VVTYHRELALAVFEGKSKKNSDPLWHGVAASDGASGDFRYVFPFLLHPLMAHFGDSTGTALNYFYPLDSKTIDKLSSPLALVNTEKADEGDEEIR
jgi:hypothetical protein